MGISCRSWNSQQGKMGTYRNCIAAQSIAAHVCNGSQSEQSEVLGNFWPAASPSNFIVGPLALPTRVA